MNAPQPWKLSESALERLLLRLAPERAAAAQEYEAIRCRLVEYFGMRGAPAPDALADDALDRVARKLEEGEVVENVRAYVYGIARRVWWESEKRRAREQAAVKDMGQLMPDRPALDSEARVECLENCLKALSPADQATIVTYYRHADHAQRLLQAERLGISYVALKTRVHRIRTTLEGCRRACIDTTAGNR
jgi:DNA-directed RNA polymerase specialized sigma24 family protein